MQATVDVQLTKTTSNTVASCHVPANEEVHYKIYNNTGKLVLSKSIIIINTEKKLLENLDVSHLPKGTYILEISTSARSIKQINIII